MLKIGLTGGIGSGKTTVSNLFAACNQNAEQVTIIDTDVIARQLVEVGKPTYTKIIQIFGSGILNKDKSINRQKLRQIIFNNPKLKIELETILHPAIKAEVKAQIDQLTSQYCIIVIPLLVETASDYALDRILVVDCDKELQIQRAMHRDQAKKDEIESILQSQVSREERLKRADDVIINDADVNNLEKQVARLHSFYLKLSKTPELR